MEVIDGQYNAYQIKKHTRTHILYMSHLMEAICRHISELWQDFSASLLL